MEKINCRQLAFVLKTTPDDARRRMIAAYCKERGTKPNAGSLNKKKSSYNTDDYPKKMDVDMLAKNMNVPHLRLAIDDIYKNYLKRSATRGYIINYPLGLIQKRIEEGKKGVHKIKFPSVLKSLLNPSDVEKIKEIWKGRYYALYKNVEFV